MHIIVIQKGYTALMYASEYGNLPVVQYLVNKGAVIDKQDKVRNHNNFLLYMVVVFNIYINICV